MDEELYAFDSSDVARISAAVKAYEGGQLPGIRKSGLPNRNYSRIPFRNDNASTAPAYGVLRVTGTTIVDGFPFLTVDKPDTSFNRFYLVNGTEDVVTSGWGWGTWLWHGGQVLYDSGTPALGEEWGPKNAQWSLSKWRYGFTILGGNDTTLTTTLAIQEKVSLIYGQTQGTIADGATGTVEVFDGNNTILNASTTISAVHRFSSTTIGDDKKVECAWNGGTWNIIAARC